MEEFFAIRDDGNYDLVNITIRVSVEEEDSGSFDLYSNLWSKSRGWPYYHQGSKYRDIEYIGPKTDTQEMLDKLRSMYSHSITIIGIGKA